MVHVRACLATGLREGGVPALCIFFFCLLLAQSAAALEASADWRAKPIDARRALPNDARPPLRTHPQTVLPPQKAGIIRRVVLDDTKRYVALTFDLCELASVTTGCDMQILGYLHERQIPATLFMGGKWMRTHRERVVQLLQEPLFEIANHAWTHGNAALLSEAGLRAQVLWTQAQYELLREEAEAALEKKGTPLKIAPVPTLYRLPYGRSSVQALQTIASLGLLVVQWDVVAEGGSVSSPARARAVAEQVVRNVRPGSILLFHANLVPTGTARVLQEMVPLLEKKGYQFVSVSQLLQMGDPERVMEGYFTRKGDNYALDKRFGIDGTGLRTPFRGEP